MSEQKIIIQEYTTLPEEARAIRTAVFVDEQGFVEEFDTQDRDAYHLILFVGEEAACCCRYFTGEEEGAYILGRLATLNQYRGQAFACKIVQEAEVRVKEHGGSSIALHAQVRAQEFYEKNGYTAYGEIELEEGVPHIWMKKSW